MDNNLTPKTTAAVKKTVLTPSVVAKKPPLKLIILILGAVALVSIVINVLLCVDIRKLKADPQYQARQEVTRLVERVGRLMSLPNEEPTVATVTDLEKLKDQPFFLNAKNGDKVLIFSAARKAVLYDPTANKIIEVAPLNNSETSSTDSATSNAEVEKK